MTQENSKMKSEVRVFGNIYEQIKDKKLRQTILKD